MTSVQDQILDVVEMWMNQMDICGQMQLEAKQQNRQLSEFSQARRRSACNDLLWIWPPRWSTLRCGRWWHHLPSRKISSAPKRMKFSTRMLSSHWERRSLLLPNPSKNFFTPTYIVYHVWFTVKDNNYIIIQYYTFQVSKHIIFLWRFASICHSFCSLLGFLGHGLASFQVRLAFGDWHGLLHAALRLRPTHPFGGGSGSQERQEVLAAPWVRRSLCLAGKMSYRLYSFIVENVWNMWCSEFGVQKHFDSYVITVRQ